VLSILFRQSTLYTGVNILVRAINFFVLPIYARVFSPEQFGIYELIWVFSAFAGLVAALEVTQGLARYYPDAQGREKAEYASSSLWFTVVAYSIFCGSVAVLARPIAELLLGSAGHVTVFRTAVLAIWSNGICLALQSQLRSQLYARYHSISAIALTTVSQGTALAYIFLVDASIEGIFFGSCMGGLAGASIAAYYGRESLVLLLSWSKLVAMLRFSTPLALSAVAVFASRYVDRIAIKELLDVHSVGIYGVAARFAALVTFMLVGFQSALLPLITTFHREPRAPGDMARVLRYFLACAMPATMFVAAYSHEIIVVLAGQAYEAGHVLVPWLALGTFLSGMHVFLPGLWLAKQTLVTLAINTSSAILTVLLALLLIPSLGLIGAALATVGGAAAGFVAVLTLSQRRYHLPLQGGRLAAAAALFACFLIAAQWLAQQWQTSEMVRAFATLAGMLSVAVILVTPSEMRRLSAGALRELRLR
jgi:O-antigen/teichoic acid export membrane protein